MKKSIGHRIKELRKEKGLTQPQLAQLVNVANSVISNWENDTNIPRSDYVAKIAEIFGVTSDYILGIEDEFGNPTTKPKPPTEYRFVKALTAAGYSLNDLSDLNDAELNALIATLKAFKRPNQ